MNDKKIEDMTDDELLKAARSSNVAIVHELAKRYRQIKDALAKPTEPGPQGEGMRAEVERWGGGTFEEMQVESLRAVCEQNAAILNADAKLAATKEQDGS